MASLELSKDQSGMLIELLEIAVSDLRMEIADTDSSFYKDKLRDKKDDLMVVLEKLKMQRDREL